jgi:hypothetical protein
LNIIAKIKHGPQFNRRRLLILFCFILFAQIIDAIVGNLADILKQFTISSLGIAIFFGLLVICIFGQFYILGMIRNKNKEQKIKGINVNVFEKITSSIQVILSAIIFIIAFQIIFYSQYNTFLLNVAIFFSIGNAMYSMSYLSYWLLSWFRLMKSPILLLYGISTGAIVISLSSATILFNIILMGKPAVINSMSVIVFPANLAGTSITIANTIQNYSSLIAFISLWIGTIILLKQNNHRIGRIKFWLLLSLPMVSFSSFYLSFFQSIAGTPLTEDIINSTILPVLLIIFSGVGSIALIGLSFSFISKPLDNNSIIKDYMIITSYGFVLFFTTTLTSISGAGFPPYGLINIILMGPFSFLIANSFYRAAISLAEDTKLRQSITNKAKEELKLLEDIGTAKIYQNFEKKISVISKENSNLLSGQTGIEPTLTDKEIKEILEDIIKERKRI